LQRSYQRTSYVLYLRGAISCTKFTIFAYSYSWLNYKSLTFRANRNFTYVLISSITVGCIFFYRTLEAKETLVQKKRKKRQIFSSRQHRWNKNIHFIVKKSKNILINPSNSKGDEIDESSRTRKFVHFRYETVIGYSFWLLKKGDVIQNILN